MGGPVCNTTLEHGTISEVPLWEGGLTFHTLGMMICGALAITAMAVSAFLIFSHATHYSKPREQLHIIRILFMVPIYSLVAFLCFWLYQRSVYFQVIGNCYEAFALASFFNLLCHYIAPDLHSQKDYFRGIRPKRWIWPLPWFQKCCGGEHGIWRTPRSGLTWFNVIWTGVFQYCLIRVTMTIVAVATQAAGRYCEASLSPAFSHLWVLVIETISVSIAMYCLIQFYLQIHTDVAQYSPFLKILAIKLVIFLSFWQMTVISLLTSSGAVKPSAKVEQQDLNIGIPSLLICIEMAAFSVLHLWAFPWHPYTIANQQATNDSDLYATKVTYQGGPLGAKAFLEAFNPWDLLKAIGRGLRWLFVGRKLRTMDASYLGQSGTSFTLKRPSGGPPGSNIPGSDGSGYQGDGSVIQDGPIRYPSDEEGQQLLSNAQPNPISYPHHSSSAGPADMNDYYEDRHGSPLSSSINEESVAGLRPISPQPYQPYPPQHDGFQVPAGEHQQQRQEGEQKI